MAGIGPFIPHLQTPLRKFFAGRSVFKLESPGGNTPLAAADAFAGHNRNRRGSRFRKAACS